MSHSSFFHFGLIWRALLAWLRQVPCISPMHPSRMHSKFAHVEGGVSRPLPPLLVVAAALYLCCQSRHCSCSYGLGLKEWQFVGREVEQMEGDQRSRATPQFVYQFLELLVLSRRRGLLTSQRNLLLFTYSRCQSHTSFANDFCRGGVK